MKKTKKETQNNKEDEKLGESSSLVLMHLKTQEKPQKFSIKQENRELLTQNGLVYLIKLNLITHTNWACPEESSRTQYKEVITSQKHLVASILK